MRTYILGFAALALLGGGAARAQAPAGGCSTGGYCFGGPACQTVCVPEHYVKETKRWTYGSRCAPLCLCYWPTLWGHCGGCGDGGQCEPPISRRQLVKYKEVCKEDAIKCVPQTVPACGFDPYRGTAGGPFPMTPTAYGAGSAFTPPPPPPTAFSPPR